MTLLQFLQGATWGLFVWIVAGWFGWLESPPSWLVALGFIAMLFEIREEIRGESSHDRRA